MYIFLYILYNFVYIYIPPLCVERILVIVFLSNRILRGNVQHPRYEPLRVQILRERQAWRSSVRQKKL